MIRVFLAIALIWLLLLPPFFTDGACDGEFNQVSATISRSQTAMATPELAQAFWRTQNVPVQSLSAEQCRRSRPRFVENCAPGMLLYVTVPIQNRVCRYYRDSAVRVQLQYDGQNRLRQLQADMKPFKYLALPWGTLNWGK
jgi:hypothetical protein